MAAALSGPMFESSAGSIFQKDGAHYNIYEVKPEVAMNFLRHFFPKGKADEMNLCFFSTSGVHGSYETIEDAEEERRSRRTKDPVPVTPITFLVVQPRIVCVRYGNVLPQTTDDIRFLRKLRASSWQAAQRIGK